MTNAVIELARQALRSGTFDQQIASVMLDTIRDGSDEGLSEVGFIAKVAVELRDRSAPRATSVAALAMARQAYRDFRQDNGVRFGSVGWDWSGSGARIIAQEYAINFWEPTP